MEIGRVMPAMREVSFQTSEALLLPLHSIPLPEKDIDPQGKDSEGSLRKLRVSSGQSIYRMPGLQATINVASQSVSQSGSGAECIRERRWLMGKNSKIEWTHHTFNPWRGCTKISPGCTNCYAEKLSKRNPATLGVWGDHGTRVVAVDSYWQQPPKWNRDAKQVRERRRVFCASLADVFEDRPELVEPRYRLFDLINQTPDLDWLLLTKRPENVIRIYDDISNHFGWDEDMSVMNIWLGVTVENQEYADRRIPELLKIPASVRFLSCEPLLGPVSLEHVNFGNEIAIDLHDVLFPQRGPRYPGNGKPFPQYPGNSIDWVIAGGESGPNARPSHLDWFRSLRDQCKAANVPFHFKQMGEHEPTVAAADLQDHLRSGDEDGEDLKDAAKRQVIVYPDGRRVIPKRTYEWWEEQDFCTGFEDGYAPDMTGVPVMMRRVGVKVAGRLLDGVDHNGFPMIVGAHSR